MSFRTLRDTFILSMLLLGSACAEEDPDEPGTGGAGAGTTSSWASGSTATGSSTSAGGVPAADWDIQADFMVNGHQVGEAIQSAVSLHEAIDGHEYISVIVTDVASFCAALGEGDCGTDPHFRLEFAIEGAAPGTYHIEDGSVSVWSGDVPQSCAGGGLGADTGTVTFTEIDLEQGVVELTFDVTFFTGHAEGTIVAPLCQVE